MNSHSIYHDKSSLQHLSLLLYRSRSSISSSEVSLSSSFEQNVFFLLSSNRHSLSLPETGAFSYFQQQVFLFFSSDRTSPPYQIVFLFFPAIGSHFPFQKQAFPLPPSIPFQQHVFPFLSRCSVSFSFLAAGLPLPIQESVFLLPSSNMFLLLFSQVPFLLQKQVCPLPGLPTQIFKCRQTHPQKSLKCR